MSFGVLGEVGALHTTRQLENIGKIHALHIRGPSNVLHSLAQKRRFENQKWRSLAPAERTHTSVHRFKISKWAQHSKFKKQVASLRSLVGRSCPTTRPAADVVKRQFGFLSFLDGHCLAIGSAPQRSRVVANSMTFPDSDIAPVS